MSSNTAYNSPYLSRIAFSISTAGSPDFSATNPIHLRALDSFFHSRIFSALVLVDVLFGKIDVATFTVDVENLADNLLALTDVVTDILDPAGCNFRDRDEPLSAVIFVKGNECDEILDIFYGADDKFRFLGPLSIRHDRLT